MVKACPECGAATVPEARYCRLCGAPLTIAKPLNADAHVSPLAQTIPLTGEARSTDGLEPEEGHRSTPNTSKVGRAEMENLLRVEPAVPVEGGRDGNNEKALQTNTLVSTPEVVSEPTETPAVTRGLPAPTGPLNTSARRKWQIAAIALLCIALVAGMLAFILARRGSSTDADGSSPISISDQKQLVSEKLAEADALIEAGEFNRAIAVLRAAVKLDPSNADARLRLGSALVRTGERNEAINEYRAALQSEPNNIAAWRALASAQSEEKLYNDAVESYRRLIQVAGDTQVDAGTRLAYADALRLAGRSEEARAEYQRITGSAPETFARTAQQHLAEMGPAPVQPDRPRDERDGTQTGAAPPPSTGGSPAGGAAESGPDAYYFKAVNLVNGRDPKSLSDGELAAALNYFLRAQGGSHSAEAKRAADRLGAEYDRRKARRSRT